MKKKNVGYAKKSLFLQQLNKPFLKRWDLNPETYVKNVREKNGRKTNIIKKNSL